MLVVLSGAPGWGDSVLCRVTSRRCLVRIAGAVELPAGVTGRHNTLRPARASAATAR
jgi:hypothetical protein